jgi:hypothetical protein
MRSAVNGANVLGWGLELRPKYVEEVEADGEAAPQKQAPPTPISLSAVFSQGSATASCDVTAPCDNTSRDAFLAIRDALNLNSSADGIKVNERTAQVCPLDIRFSQSTVKFVFGSSGTEVSKVVSSINIVKQDHTDILACPFPPIRCIWWEPKDGSEPGWFSLDNRRLLALQQRAIQAEHPHQCLAEVIIVDRLPDPSISRQKNFCQSGHAVNVTDGSRWSWQEALAKVCEEKIEMSDDDSTAASDGPKSEGNSSSLDPSPVHQAMGTKADDVLTPISLENALGLEPTPAPTPCASPQKPQVLTSLEAALGLHPGSAACTSPTNAFAGATLPPPLPASAPNPVDEAWSSLQNALGMEETAAYPSPARNAMQPPCLMPDYATALELMNCMAANCAANMLSQHLAANGLNTSAQPWSPPEETLEPVQSQAVQSQVDEAVQGDVTPRAGTPPASPEGSKIVELDAELAKAAAQVPVKTHLKAPYRRPTDDEIAERLQNITIKPSVDLKPVREETTDSDKENAVPTPRQAPVVKKVEKFRI